MSSDKTIPIWKDIALDAYPSLSRDTETDVVVIGAGVTGLTAARALHQAGRRVIVLDRQAMARGETGNTTAHLTAFIDVPLLELVKAYGEATARSIWEAGVAAQAYIEQAVHDEQIDCEFERCEGYVLGALDEQETAREGVEFASEATVARDLGFDAHYTDAVPIFNRPGYRLDRQAKVHPTKYLRGIARGLAAQGVPIYENSPVASVDDDHQVELANGHRIQAKYIVVATHVPIIGHKAWLTATAFQSKLLAYSTYVVSGLVRELPSMLLWDSSDPYYYLRFDQTEQGTRAIFGGRDHKTGQEKDTPQRYEALEQMLKRYLPEFRADRRWSGQVINTPDGLPYIGWVADHQYACTGYNGNGITLGTIAGIMACDAILERESPWEKIFIPSRKPIMHGGVTYVRENLDYPTIMASDTLQSLPREPVALQPGEGQVVRGDGQKVACAIDRNGREHRLNAVCPHMGCVVRWNVAEQTWDCPCHGSRFAVDGSLLAGPAEQGLERLPAAQHAAAAAPGEVSK